MPTGVHDHRVSREEVDMDQGTDQDQAFEICTWAPEPDADPRR